MRVTPAGRISRLERDAGSVSVVIPGRVKPVAIFLLFWLACWSIGGLASLFQVAQSFRSGSPNWSLVLFLVVWLLGETAVLLTLAYMVAGREVVTVRSSELEIRTVLFGFGPARQYDLSLVQNLRVNASGRRNGYMALAFDYGAQTIRFGRGIDEAEAAIVLRDLASTGSLPPVEQSGTFRA